MAALSDNYFGTDATQSSYIFFDATTTGSTYTTENVVTASRIHVYRFYVNGIGYHDEEQARLAANESWSRAHWLVPQKLIPHLPRRATTSPCQRRNSFSASQKSANHRRFRLQKLRQSR